MFAKNRRCSKYRFFLKAACLQRAAAIVQASQLLGSGVLDHFFLTGSILTIFFHMGQGDPAKTSQFTIIELRPAPILLKPPLSGSALFSYMLNQG